MPEDPASPPAAAHQAVKTDDATPDPSGDKLRVKVYSPFKTYFNEGALSISAVNDTGAFDILPKHHNFITLLQPCDLKIVIPNGSREIRISGGIMHVRSNTVTVFLDV
jgi:F0F1-type ATP synthase epsilon subunit